MVLTHRSVRNRYVLIADVAAVATATWAAFAVRFTWLFMDSRPEFSLFLGTALVLKISVFFAFGLYRRYWRYAAFWDLMAVVLANTVAAILLTGAMVAFRLADVIPGLSRSVVLMDWLLCLALTTGVRASIRIVSESTAARAPLQDRRRRRVLIIGAGDAGALVAREMQKNPQLGMIPVGFLDDDSTKISKRIYGVPVLGSLDKIGAIVESRQVDEAIIALPRAGGAVIKAVAESCRLHSLTSRVMPGLYELLDGQFGISRLRDIDIADLLQRPQVAGSPESPRYLADAVVVITGAGGSIGAELARQVAHANPKQLVMVGHGENSIFDAATDVKLRFPHVQVRTVIADVRDANRIAKVLRSIRPDVVFHAAAHKHVPLMEENISEAITNNVLGTRNVVQAAAAASTPRLVLVSTDKAAAPSSVMGASKRVGEMIVRDMARRQNRAYVVVRFGNVLGSRGSVVPLFKAQIERGGPVTVTHPDVRRYFMTIPEAVHLVLQAGGLGTGGELFVLDMGRPVLMREMAADMIKLSGCDPEEIPIVFTGLRQGEKLDEVLWEDGAEVSPTAQPDIRRVTEADGISSEHLAALVDRMIEDAGRDEARVIRSLSDCIPTATLSARPDSWGQTVDALRVVRTGASG